MMENCVLEFDFPRRWRRATVHRREDRVTCVMKEKFLKKGGAAPRGLKIEASRSPGEGKRTIKRIVTNYTDNLTSLLGGGAQGDAMKHEGGLRNGVTREGKKEGTPMLTRER